jgi:hypothetical protein
MNILYRAFNGKDDWVWVCDQIPLTYVEDTCGIMAIDTNTDKIVGAVIFDNWTDNSVQTHFIVTTPMLLRHGFLEYAYTFIFVEKGCKFMYGLVPSNNHKACTLNKHMGFTEKTRMTDAYADGVDFILMELKRENCKFLTNTLSEAA